MSYHIRFYRYKALSSDSSFYTVSYLHFCHYLNFLKSHLISSFMLDTVQTLLSFLPILPPGHPERFPQWVFPSGEGLCWTDCECSCGDIQSLKCGSAAHSSKVPLCIQSQGPLQVCPRWDTVTHEANISTICICLNFKNVVEEEVNVNTTQRRRWIKIETQVQSVYNTPCVYSSTNPTLGLWKETDGYREGVNLCSTALTIQSKRYIYLFKAH